MPSDSETILQTYARVLSNDLVERRAEKAVGKATKIVAQAALSAIIPQVTIVLAGAELLSYFTAMSYRVWLERRKSNPLTANYRLTVHKDTGLAVLTTDVQPLRSDGWFEDFPSCYRDVMLF